MDSYRIVADNIYSQNVFQRCIEKFLFFAVFEAESQFIGQKFKKFNCRQKFDFYLENICRLHIILIKI